MGGVISYVVSLAGFLPSRLVASFSNLYRSIAVGLQGGSATILPAQFGRTDFERYGDCFPIGPSFFLPGSSFAGSSIARRLLSGDVDAGYIVWDSWLAILLAILWPHPSRRQSTVALLDHQT